MAVKSQGIGMGVNLGFIQKIVLTDGTVLENMQVLYRSPIPTQEQLLKILMQAANASITLVGRATPQWSAYPETMTESRLFKKNGGQQ